MKYLAEKILLENWPDKTVKGYLIKSQLGELKASCWIVKDKSPEAAKKIAAVVNPPIHEASILETSDIIWGELRRYFLRLWPIDFPYWVYNYPVTRSHPGVIGPFK